MVVRAPFSGVAISKDAQPGEMISPVSAGGGFTRTGICTIVDMSSLEIEVDVNESYINRVKHGPESGSGARRVSGLADPGARDHDDPDRRSPEGDGEGAHRVRRARSAHPAGHGREGLVPARRAGTGRPARRARRARWCRRPRCARPTDGRWCSSSRTIASSAARSASGLENGDQVEVMSGVTRGRARGRRRPADAQGRRQGEGR